MREILFGLRLRPPGLWRIQSRTSYQFPALSCH